MRGESVVFMLVSGPSSSTEVAEQLPAEDEGADENTDGDSVVSMTVSGPSSSETAKPSSTPPNTAGDGIR
jgi:hypothetical protein